jgi:Chalcone isomerase-like
VDDFSPERWAQSQIALEIEYARKLLGNAIAERSLDEMRRQGDLPEARAESWLAEMRRLFPDVKEGDRITGVKLPGVGAAFYVNGRLRGEVRDADFARRFFGIWLAPQTSEPALRQRLLGGTA